MFAATVRRLRPDMSMRLAHALRLKSATISKPVSNDSHRSFSPVTPSIYISAQDVAGPESWLGRVALGCCVCPALVFDKHTSLVGFRELLQLRCNLADIAGMIDRAMAVRHDRNR